MDVMLHRQSDPITQGIHPLLMQLPIHNQINAECLERTYADTGARAEHHSWISFGGPLLDKGHAISIALHPLPPTASTVPPTTAWETPSQGAQAAAD